MEEKIKVLLCEDDENLGKLRIRGISLGVAFVFFMGIVAGSLHFTADEQMISFAETFGLSLFVYALCPPVSLAI